MKRLLLLALITVIGVIKISAQEIDMSQENSTAARIEELSQEVVELSQKLEKLQEDCDYNAFISELYRLLHSTAIFKNEVAIKINEITIWCYNSRFDIDLYLVTEDTYGQFQELYEHYLQRKDDISKQISNVTFSSEKLNHINILYDMIDSDIEYLGNYLSILRNTLDVYKNKGKRY
ncbi:MAG: hypothetical protein IJZ78_06675 [Alistipes sp.]|nr:hypothetical protein [Alistipes sp.]